MWASNSPWLCPSWCPACSSWSSCPSCSSWSSKIFCSLNFNFSIDAKSINDIVFAFLASDSKGFSMNASKSSPIQNTISAFSIISAWEGLKTKVWGLFVPSIIREGLPTPSITLDINEWRGLIVVTTLTSALALKLKNNGTKIIKIDFLMKFILITPLNVILLHT